MTGWKKTLDGGFRFRWDGAHPSRRGTSRRLQAFRWNDYCK
jgi:hypothetical protein